jgi:hypothetical protein
MESQPDRSIHPPCPVCNSIAPAKLVHIQGVPVFCNVLRETREQALRAESGDIDLVFCNSCAHVFNAAFDPERITYNPQYDNTLDYSPTFQKYIRQLTQRLVSAYQLQEKDIIEVGCGQGEFLRRLAQSGQNRCLGFDPSYNDRQDDSEPSNGRITIIQDHYSKQYAHHRADFLVCRQVLEHIKEPVAFLRMIRSAGTGRADPIIFVEVPNAMHTIKDLGIWDLIYEHCGYFTSLSLSRLFIEAGLTPLNLEEAFGGQYLCIEGHAANQDRERHPAGPDLSAADVKQDVRAFSDNYRHTVSEWQRILAEIRNSGAKAAIWGAGSKGVTFLNLMPSRDVIDFVIDINPHKQGLYVPGTGQQVMSPDRLAETLPEVIIVMNPIYLEEIQEMVNNLNLPKDLNLLPVNQF